MSLSGLLLAVRDKLRSGFEDLFPEDMIRVMPDGRPIPKCGQRFISVYGSGWEPRTDDADMNQGVAEVYSVTCTLSSRTPVVPVDAIGEEIYIKEMVGMEAICRKIRNLIHQQYDVINLANAYSDEPDGILEYLRWIGTDPNPRPVGPEWFYSENPGVDSWEYAESGMVMDVRFTEAFQLTHLYNDPYNT